MFCCVIKTSWSTSLVRLLLTASFCRINRNYSLFKHGEVLKRCKWKRLSSASVRMREEGEFVLTLFIKGTCVTEIIIVIEVLEKETGCCLLCFSCRVWSHAFFLHSSVEMTAQLVTLKIFKFLEKCKATLLRRIFGSVDAEVRLQVENHDVSERSVFMLCIRQEMVTVLPGRFIIFKHKHFYKSDSFKGHWAKIWCGSTVVSRLLQGLGLPPNPTHDKWKATNILYTVLLLVFIYLFNLKLNWLRFLSWNNMPNQFSQLINLNQLN